MDEIVNESLSIPDNDHVTGSSELKVATKVWFSSIDGVLVLTELEITGLFSSTSVTVTVTAKASLTFPALSVAISDTLYSLLLTPAFWGFSKSGGELNVSSPAFEMLKSALSVPDSDQVTVSFALYVDTAVWFSWTDTVSLPVITGLSSSTSVTAVSYTHLRAHET